MYEVDHQDRVVEIHDAPQSSVGAPIPILLADERAVVLAYCIEGTLAGMGWFYDSGRRAF
jgi:hypothetical protein